MIAKIIIGSILLFAIGFYTYTVIGWWREGDQHFKLTASDCAGYEGSMKHRMPAGCSTQ